MAKPEDLDPAMAVDAARNPAGMPPQQQPEHCQAERTERHQADFDFAPGQFLAEHRAQRDTDREHRENQRHHGFVAVHPLLGISRDLCQINRADKPEP
ncbi:hypothetical protein D3C87_1787290 [compost metagenome]